MFLFPRDFSLDLTLVEEEAEEEEEQVPANNSSSSSLDDDAFFQDCVSVQEEEDHRPHSQHRLIHQSQGHHHEQDFPMERIGVKNSSFHKRIKGFLKIQKMLLFQVKFDRHYVQSGAKI